MKELDDLKKCFGDYVEYTASLRKQYAPGAGLLGFGRGPKDDPGHMKFYDDAKALAETLAATEPSPEIAAEAVEFILHAEEENQKYDLAVWMLMAAQGIAIPLIPYLKPEDAARIRDWYGRRYPRHKRLPIQNEVFKALGL
ncbi:MAG: hypothetical protein LUI02_03780 [Clostridiales bacterium]|nr:hypothetical protein [Clostridiales bacterium]